MSIQDSSPPAQDPSDQISSNFDVALKKRYFWDRVFQIASWAAVAIGLIVLVTLLVDVFLDGLPRLDWTLLSEFPSRKPQQAGLKSALVGTIWLMVLTAAISFPLGVGAGIFLEEFAVDTWYAKIIEVNINNLAAVPSIIYGLLGVELFARIMSPITGGRGNAGDYSGGYQCPSRGGFRCREAVS